MDPKDAKDDILSLQQQLEVALQKNRELEDLLDLKLKEVCDLNESLESAVVERTRELSSALAKSKILAQAKNQFLANMSHELRTPLNAIIGFAKVIQSKTSDPAVDYSVLKIEQAGLRLLDHVERIFEFSNLDTSSYQVQNRSFLVGDLIEQFKKQFGVKSRQKNLDLKFKVSEELPKELFGDDKALIKIADILIDNAIRYTDQGAVLVQIGKETSPLNGVDVFTLAVTDTGSGISEDQMVDIFAPFSQADNSDNRKHGGVGLGLTLASRLAQALGAEIRVESSLGQGSTFKIWYPLNASDGPILNRPDVDPVEKIKEYSPRLKVLTVDDDDTNNLLMKAILSSLGIDTLIAKDGQQALQVIKDHPDINLVLMDCQMPVMDGVEATRQLRAMGNSATIIAVTANGQPDNKQSCFNVGMNGFVVKPISQQKIAEAVVDTLWFVADVA